MTRWLLALVVAVGGAHAARAADAPARPNVLFIAIDDLRDWVGYLGDKQAKTPNMDRLAARGVHFTRSYCAAPVCNPSRTALMSGLRPGSTGVYENNADWRTTPAAKVPHLTQHFRANGYAATGSGKIYHGSYPPEAAGGYWDEFLAQGDAEDAPKKKKAKDADTSWGYGNFRFGPLPAADNQMVDYHIVDYCLKQLAKKHDKPFFLACGIHKPHLSWEVPKKYFDMYPLDQITLPAVRKNDLEGVPPAGVKMAKPQGDHKTITEAGKWKEAVRAYLAAISFCDAMVGRILDGFDRSAYRDNTVVVFWSDHGWHLGEKDHWRKFALWEQATRSPLIYVVPGVTKPGTVCHRPVDLMTIYPTLCDLCGLPTPKHVQGKSIRPLLADPGAKWDDPAVTTYLFRNHAARSEKWRYIRYANGDEELYDHDADPHEWKNLAGDTRFADVKKELAARFPKENLPDAGRKGKGKGKE
jgi:arylsulfatase A-like enzyme